MPCRLSKRQSMFTTVLFRTLTPMHHAPPTCETRVNLLRPLHMRPVDRAGPVTGMKAGWILTARMALSELALPAVFYRHKNPINYSDTAFRVAEVMMGAKVKISVFCHVCLVSGIWCRSRPQNLWPFLISETGLKFLIWTQSEIHPGNQANPVKRAHVKKPLICGF